MSICWHFKWSKADFLSLTEEELDAAVWTIEHATKGG